MPVTDVQWGKSTWVNYVDNWTDVYADYVQRKGISRFHTAAERDAALPSPYPGEVCYNLASDRLELRSNAGAWLRMSFLPLNLTSWQDDVTGVAMGHNLSGNKGVIFGPTDVKVTLPLNVLNGVTYVDSTGLNMKTGVTTVKITTDGVGLALDKPVTAPTFVPTAALAIDAVGKEIKGNFTGGSIAGSTGTFATSVSTPSVVVGSTNIASALDDRGGRSAPGRGDGRRRLQGLLPGRDRSVGRGQGGRDRDR